MAESDVYQKYLDPRALARVKSLELRTRQVVEGLQSGRHRSPHQGSSVEFAQHRQYAQGDDVRHIDWKVYGRSDKLYIKQFQVETQLQIILVVDASESMAFGSVKGEDGSTWTKYDHATTLAATLAYMALGQSDAVGLAIFDQGLSRYFRPSATSAQWRTVITELQGVPRWNKTGTGKVLEQLASKINRRSLVILLSDFFDDLAGLKRGLRALRFRKHDVICAQLLDPQEIEFPFEEITMFKGLEESGELLTEPRALRQGYLQVLGEFTDQLKRTCRSIDVDFARFNTGDSLDVPLSAFLAQRAATMTRT